MTTQNQLDTTTLRRTARLAGILYLIIIASGIYAQFFVRTSLINPTDAAQTAAELTQFEQLFRNGIAADLIMIVADVGIGILFYVLLKPVDQAIALLAAFFRLAQAATLGVNLLNLYLGLQLITSGQSSDLALQFLNAHGYGYALALVFFGFSILAVGYLLIRATYFPSLLGILLMIAAVGYIADGFARTLLVNYASVQPIFDYAVFMPAFLAELAIALFLLIRGVRQTQPNPVVATATA